MIVCAAVLVQIEGVDHQTILPCRRHGDAFKILKDLVYVPKTKYKIVEQGFISDRGRFYDRRRAYLHACRCGQLSQTTKWYKDDHNDHELYSEDLY